MGSGQLDMPKFRICCGTYSSQVDQASRVCSMLGSGLCRINVSMYVVSWAFEEGSFEERRLSSDNFMDVWTCSEIEETGS